MADLPENKGKPKISIVIAGHVDAGKSTTTGHLIFKLGSLDEREMEKLRTRAKEKGMESFAFAYVLDTTPEEQDRGVTIKCTTKEFFTTKFHYTVIDAPGHRDYIKNMITGSSQTDVALLLVPADGNFEAAITAGDVASGSVPGQTRAHALILDLLGIRQLIVGVNKMDSKPLAAWKQSRYEEVASNVVDCLVKVGWKADFIEKRVPIIPFSGWTGDNLLEKSTNMDWWKGKEVQIGDTDEKVMVITLVDALDKMVRIPYRDPEGLLRMPVNGVISKPGIGTIITGNIERGTLKEGSEVVFYPRHTSALSCVGKVGSIEMHHKSQPEAGPGENVGVNVKNLKKENMPKAGDIMCLKSDTTIRPCKAFVAAVKVLEHPGELKVGYCPTAYVRTAHCAVRMTQIRWKLGKSTGKVKLNNPGPKTGLKTKDVAEVVFTPQKPFVVEAFKDCEGLGRVAIMEGKGVQMLGKVTEVFHTDEDLAASEKAFQERASKETAAAPPAKEKKKDKGKKKEKDGGKKAKKKK